MIDTVHPLPFREYLRLQGTQVKNPPQDEGYDALILKVWEFFSLRVRAEDYFSKHRYVAKTAKGALPLPWREIQSVFSQSGPPETTLTLIAKRHFGTIDALVGNVRKVLSRERSKVPIGRVQQVDPHCLRWLTRQPGYSPIEKAGARQEILGIVRRENFDTLENRVLKDFLRRCLALASVYLRRNDKVEWKEEATIIAVKRLKALCIGALGLPEFEKVKAMSDLPQPNYVLQQDRLYSRIWGEYLKILREEDVAERLWDRREEVDALHRRLHDGVETHCSPCAKYDTPIWFNELDGRNPLLEAPIWDNELMPSPVVEPVQPSEDVFILDLTFPWQGRDMLVCPTKHPNAHPFIQNPFRPSLEQGKALLLEQIIENRDEEHLADYLRHLHGMLGGKRWIVLVPDHWEASWLERVIVARPPALGPRNNFFLLWRSVAAALECAGTADYKVGDELVIADGYSSRKYNGVLIRFWNDGSGRAVPQRASTRLHGGAAKKAETRFCLKCDIGDHDPLRNLANGRKICRIGRLRTEDDITPNGAQRFLEVEEHGQTPYFDELDALSMVVTNRAEEVFFNALVQHEECWPGGRKYEGERLSQGHLTAGSRSLRLYLAEGNTSNNGKLSEKVIEFDVTAERDEDVFCQAEIIPGQGLATVYVSSAFLERPLMLDLQTMTPSEMTLVRIERELKRHFPPTMPCVEACRELWEEALKGLRKFKETGKLDNALFYKPQDYWGVVRPDAKASSGARRFGVDHYFDEKTMSPIDKLKRENVFGNNPDNRYPDPTVDFQRIFKWMCRQYVDNGNGDFLRLIAWTYQQDNPDFEPIRNALFVKYVRNRNPLTVVEASFCSNNFDDEDERMHEILQTALKKIASGTQKDDELRLAYNLMQFHPSALKSCSTSLCEAAFNTLVIMYNRYDFYINSGGFWKEWNNGTATKMAGYFIKCMLFILHRRRYDSCCLIEPKGWTVVIFKDEDGVERPKLQPFGQLKDAIPCKHDDMRRNLIEYVNGRGKLEGFVQAAKDD